MTFEKMDNIREEARCILNELFETYNSFEDFVFSGGTKDCWNNFKLDVDGCVSSITAKNGAFRGVIIDDDFDWVIKFDFIDECETGCYNEVINYGFAVENNVNEYFAPCFFGGNFHEVPFYLMKRMCIDENEISFDAMSDLYNSDERYANYDGEMYAEDAEIVINIFGKYYNYKDVYKLIHFCEDYHINDLHEGNIGYHCGMPIIVDYAC